MEEHNSVVVLATSLKNNMDRAFLRRVHFFVDFPFPDKKYCLEIWKKIFPEKAPLGSDIDFKFLAERFELSGGNILSGALNAAGYAAAEVKTITMKHIVKAVAREYKKLGKMNVVMTSEN